MMKQWMSQAVRTVALGALVSAGAVALAPQQAEAFCGFYVSGGDAELFNDATQVVMMREGTQTILSMQNNYQGPTKSSPWSCPCRWSSRRRTSRPCPRGCSPRSTSSAPRGSWSTGRRTHASKTTCITTPARRVRPRQQRRRGERRRRRGPKVTVEAEFEVGEYEVVMLSATEANALETWLTDNSYNIPSGAAPIFNQYIQQGMYFFVAKVDPAKVTFEDNQAVLSPLRFDYDSPTFSLPVRLGMVNSAGTQDLIVYILSQAGRYAVSNYDNVTIPTNIEVSKDVRQDFGTFYTKLFERTVEQNPRRWSPSTPGTPRRATRARARRSTPRTTPRWAPTCSATPTTSGGSAGAGR